MRFYPYKKGEAEKVLAILKGRQTKFNVSLTQELEVIAILKGGGGAKVSSLQKGGGGGKKFDPVLIGGGGGGG